jgi:hypothetical protein
MRKLFDQLFPMRIAAGNRLMDTMNCRFTHNKYAFDSIT